MTDEENRQGVTPQQTPQNLLLDDPENAAGEVDTPDKIAIEQFKGIKQALIGTEPEWSLPEVNPKALASKP